MSLLPPGIAILCAFVFRRVILSLFVGVWCGALLLNELNPITASVRTLDHHLINAIATESHARILLFTLFLGGMVHLITKSGGGHAFASIMVRRATTRRSGQLTAYFMGWVIFFDDYANSLLIGSSMRPIFDRLRISREKLAFIVDATAAPIASLALVSSWIAVEVGYIADQFQHLGVGKDAYLTFIATLPYRSYPWLMLFFVFWIVWVDRDFASMLRAERHAQDAHHLDAQNEERSSVVPEGNWLNAVLPIALFIAVAIGGIFVDGYLKLLDQGREVTLQAVISEASSSKAILWASGAAMFTALITSIRTGAFRFKQAAEVCLAGLKTMVLPAAILVLAWSISGVCRDLQTAEYLVQSIGSWIRPELLAAGVFVVSALVSFATGTSWGTMAILFPLVVPLAHQLAPGSETIMLGTISSILTGSVWGDHCSPISDTTILSSLATGCDHVAHVRTQLPYALVVGLFSLVLGEVAVGFGLYPAWVGVLLGIIALAIFVLIYAKNRTKLSENQLN